MNKQLPFIFQFAFFLLLLGTVFFMLLPNRANATHIVGGELELQHLGGSTYQLGLIVYFDDVNGQPGARDLDVYVTVFRKSDNRFMQNFLLPLRADNFVQYTNPACAVGSLRTRRLYYYRNITMSPTVYDDPEGYYFVHERCCRNNGIGNIIAPQDAAQTFYLEVPPVVKDGQPFINSSPVLFPPLSDYACINQPFWFDFSGTDSDGDSLAYSLAIPLNGISSRFNPKPDVMSPRPYSQVLFRPGYRIDNMIRGNPPLQINQRTGFLTLIPSEIGLFVFSIRCEEFRNGEKIGEVVRDFQMMVLDCPMASPPVIASRRQTTGTLVSGDTILISPDVDDRCFELLVTDPNQNTRLQTRVLSPDGISNDVLITPVSVPALLNPGDTARYRVCLSDCPSQFNKVFPVDIIVGDNSCSLPLHDTLSVFLDIRLPNQPPVLSGNQITFNADSSFYEATVRFGEDLTFEMIGLDEDLDAMLIRAIGQGFNLAALGMTFPNTTGTGEVRARFRWRPDCRAFPNNKPEEVFYLDIELSDFGECGVKSTTRARVKITVIFDLQPNNAPKITAGNNDRNGGTLIIVRDTVRLGDAYVLDLSVFDADQDRIELIAQANGFNLADLGISFPMKEGIGQIDTQFFWQSLCDNLPQALLGETQRLLVIDFLAKDYNECFLQSVDTLRLELLLTFEPDPANKPVIDIPNAVFNQDSSIFEITAIANQVLELEIIVTDQELAQLNLSSAGLGFSLRQLGFVITDTIGVSPLRARLRWMPDCDLLEAGPRVFSIQFLTVNRAKCGIESFQTIRLKINLADFEAASADRFPNAFTPNGDNIGDAYRITELPGDTCLDQFEYVEITNRWGEIVYRSEERDFAWFGSGRPSGVYFFFIKYTKKSFKGEVHLLKGN
jgi:gliding motility-associated-like protein